MENFRSGKVKVLVATDIAARGIDVKNISHIVNYDLPNEPENYVHRIGRTARAGAKGVAYSFCEARDRDFLHEIERITKNKTREAEHKYHSLTAKNAVGAAARPLPKGRGRSFGGNRGGNDRRPRFGGNNQKFEGRRASSSEGRSRPRSSGRRSTGSRPNQNPRFSRARR